MLDRLPMGGSFVNTAECTLLPEQLLEPQLYNGTAMKPCSEALFGQQHSLSHPIQQVWGTVCCLLSNKILVTLR